MHSAHQKVGLMQAKATKQPYCRPTVKQLTPAQARQILRSRANCSDQEALEFLELLRREQQKPIE